MKKFLSLLSRKTKLKCMCVIALAIADEQNSKVSWGVAQYLKYGLVNYAVQLSIALLVMLVVL